MPRKAATEEPVVDQAQEQSVDTTEEEKPKAKTKPDRTSKILDSKTLEAITKAHGKSIICRASEHHASKSHFITSGSFALDYALGGGWRAGSIHTVWGPKSSGKTSTILKTIGSAQKLCANCWTVPDPKCECGKYREPIVAYVNVEGTWDGKWAASLGVDLDKLLLSETEYAEQALDIGEALLRTGEMDIFVLDSLAFMTPEKEIEESTAKDLMGVQARVLGKGIRKFVAALNKVGNTKGRKPTIFFTNQVRFKLGLLFGNPETQSGGQAPQFAASTETKFKQPKYEFEKSTKKARDESEGGLTVNRPLWVDFAYRVEKNKQGGQPTEGTYRILLVDSETHKKGDVVDESSILDWAERYEIVKKEGSGWLCAGSPFKTKKSIEEGMLSDPNFKRLLSQTVLGLLLGD